MKRALLLGGILLVICIISAGTVMLIKQKAIEEPAAVSSELVQKQDSLDKPTGNTMEITVDANEEVHETSGQSGESVEYSLESDQSVRILSTAIDDVENWNHPVKNVIKDSEYSFGELVRVELYDIDTYPVFYLNINDWDAFIHQLNKGDFFEFINEIANANGYWSYEIKDTGNRIDIKVTCDTNNRTVSDCAINGYLSFKEYMLSVVDNPFSEYLKDLPYDKVKKELLCSGDLDGDGKEEGILNFSGDLYLISDMDGKAYQNLGRLVDNYSVGHNYTGADIRSLDRTGKKYIVINIVHDAETASGYFIYDYDGSLPECIVINFPGATAYGRCELFDYDNDGTQDNVTYYEYTDVEQHTVIEYSDFLSDKVSRKLSYDNDKNSFFYPGTPEEVIKAYIEASCMVTEAGMERDYFLLDPKLKGIKLGFSVNTLTYREIDLTITKLDETEGEGVYEVTEESLEGDIVKSHFHLKQYSGQWKIAAIELP
ncbi:hypothetical protein QA584_19055 [Anaerocolumna sp. AGMB13025]|uniref:hypothetical protein n=1 Tax=Anaerocolumna sp. AGMB13025 TaxID=3039116 RepID=UPI00241F19DD|nr:hypothetical protein [Anaerocolumna sp. AGMB13025]WFR55698.1 hypothetical protein QA584_19055 [Anaerocolumna sp. AGMB13025]